MTKSRKGREEIFCRPWRDFFGLVDAFPSAEALGYFQAAHGGLWVHRKVPEIHVSVECKSGREARPATPEVGVLPKPLR